MDELNAQIVPLVRNLLGGCGSFVRGGSLEIIDCRSGDLTARRDDGNCDRFTISIPYCGTTLRWQVIFNSNRPRQAPDFIFDDVDFCPKLANLKTLTDWDSSDENCLRAAVFELLMQYRDYQLTEARRVNVIRFETDFLSENDEYSRFETYVVKETQETQRRTRLCIQLPVDFSLIPSYFTRNLPGDDAATLSLVFYGPTYDRVRTKLRLSSRLEKLP
ncbi:BRISC and BRCA1-A complex member 2-like [Oscarella lobularis]|uniref:BRISC and BRCA1-A complex member 2-like n=1 Tax=Oscarella lobularis TaxID=121494 RepID=UPI0033144A52